MANFWQVHARALGGAQAGKPLRLIVQAPNEQRARVMIADDLEDRFDGWIIDEVTGPASSREAFSGEDAWLREEG